MGHYASECRNKDSNQFVNYAQENDDGGGNHALLMVTATRRNQITTHGFLTPDAPITYAERMSYLAS